MPTITVTEDFACTLTTLQHGGIILKYKAGRWSDLIFLVSPVPNGYNRGNNPRIAEGLVKQLVKLHLIEEGDKRYFGSSIKKVWKITPQGQGFKLPPRAFWVSNDPAS